MANSEFGFTPLPRRDKPTIVPMLTRIDRFRRRHPEIRISAPYSGTGKWEVSEPSGEEPDGEPVPGNPARAYDRGTDMMDDLEARYPE